MVDLSLGHSSTSGVSISVLTLYALTSGSYTPLYLGSQTIPIKLVTSAQLFTIIDR